MKKKLAILLAALMAMGTLASCGSAPAPAETAAADDAAAPTEFKVMYTVWVGSAPLFIAQEKGFFEQYGIAPELVLNEDESQTAALLVSGAVQAESCVVDKVVSDYASGTDERIAFIFDESSGGDGVIASAEITCVEDLAGKKVGLDTSSTEYYFFDCVLADHGMTWDDIELVDIDCASAGAAFITGELDAAVVWEPWMTNASQREGGHVLVSSADYPRVIMDSCVVNTAFYNEHPEAIDALLSAWDDALAYLAENPEESIQIMADGLDLTYEDMESMIPLVTFMGRADNEAFFDASADDSVYSVVDRMASFWIANGVAGEDFDVSELVAHQ